MIVGLLAAVGASVGYGVATILQAIGTRRAHGMAAFANRLVLGGLALDVACFALSLLAFARLPLFVVETVIAASVVVVVLLARPFLGAPLRGVDLAAAGGVVLSLVVLAGASGHQPPVHAAGTFLTATLVGAGLLAALLAGAYATGPAWLLGLVSALGYAGVAIGARGARTDGGLLHVVLQPMALVVGGCGVIAVVAYVRALERGSVGLAAATVSVVEVLVPGLVGAAFLGDTVRPGWLPGVVAAVAVALTGCVILARSPANEAAGG